MLSYKIETSGPLFTNKNVFDRLLNDAIKETAGWEINAIKNITPVKTGMLKAGWEVTVDDLNIVIDNPVNYAPYVDARFQIIASTLPDVQQRLMDSTQRLIKDRVK